MRGGKSNHRGRGNQHQNNRQGRGFFKPGENDRPQPQVRRHTLGPISLEFEDFQGSKKNDLPPGALEFLTKPVPNNSIESTSETDVGISEYINLENDGFDAIIKHRYSDFNVNEIDLDGNVVKLTSFEIPTDTSNRWVSAEDEKKNEEEREYPDYDTLADEITPFVSQLSWCRITQLAKKYDGTEKPFDTEAIRIDVSEASKENRTSIHKTIKSAFPFLTSQTEDGPDGKKFIVVKFTTGQNDRTNNSWPKGRGKFLHFVLHKTDGDLAAIFSQVGDMMGSKSERGGAGRFKIAGLKDRRGRTSQWVSIGYTSAEKVRTLFRKSKSRAFVGNFVYKSQSLELGDLNGNHFSIVLRNVRNEAKETVEKCLSALEKKGFINYFGLQRFGTVPSVKTSDIGLAMIRSNWLNAIELILKPRPNEDQTLARTRAFWWMYRDPEHALKLLGNSPFGPLERKILVGLKESNPNDFVGALGFLPKNSRLLYIHSYQSLIWNQAVSKRFKQFGDSVVIGDLVLLPDSKETVQLDTVDKFPESEEDIKKESLKYQQIEERIVEVNEDNIKNFTIYDVVMPIPGWRVRVPSNPSLKSIYTELLEKDNLQGFESFRHKVDFYSLPGAYRKIVVKPWNFAYKLIEYNDPNQDLILSDLDLMWKKSLPEVEQSPNGTKFTAVIIEMSLPSSTYATMALREAMKRDTSKSAQRSLTDAHILKFGAKTGEEDQGAGGTKREGDGQSEDPVKRVKTSHDSIELAK